MTTYTSNSKDTDIDTNGGLLDSLHFQLVPHAVRRELAEFTTLATEELELPPPAHRESDILPELEQSELDGVSLETMDGQSSGAIPVPMLDSAMSRVRRHLIWMVVALVGVVAFMAWL